MYVIILFYVRSFVRSTLQCIKCISVQLSSWVCTNIKLIWCKWSCSCTNEWTNMNIISIWNSWTSISIYYYPTSKSTKHWMNWAIEWMKWIHWYNALNTLVQCISPMFVPIWKYKFRTLNRICLIHWLIELFVLYFIPWSNRINVMLT